MPSVAVNVFNTSSVALNVSVNNGQQFSIAGVSHDWIPRSAATNPSFTYGSPAPGTFGMGNNMLMVTPQGFGSPFMIQIQFSPSLQWISIQLYLFIGNNGGTWVVLNNGQSIAQGSFGG